MLKYSIQNIGLIKTFKAFLIPGKEQGGDGQFSLLVLQQVKLLKKMSSYTGVLIPLPAAPLMVHFPADVPGKPRMMLPPRGRPGS